MAVCGVARPRRPAGGISPFEPVLKVMAGNAGEMAEHFTAFLREVRATA
jgi:hypothetical protein